MKTLREVLRQNRIAIRMWMISLLIFTAVLLLYALPVEPVLYTAVLSTFFLAVFLTRDWFQQRRRAKERERVKAGVLTEWMNLPAPEGLMEEDYGEMILTLGKRLERLSGEHGVEREETLDYFTMWVHQIKTPIAVMKLKLAEDTPENRSLSAELFRIEQYVDMVLQYIRIGSSSNDLLIREYPLDDLIRESIRKFAPQFIGKKLLLDFTPTGETVITDRKWFECILDQFLSNAIKYTPSGTVSVFAENGMLTVADTGIGIAEEDLPRIFEKGYTGRNGRIGCKSSGIGLYLAKKAADLLAMPVGVSGTPGHGSAFSVTYRREE